MSYPNTKAYAPSLDVNDNVYAYKGSLVAPAIVCVFGFGCKAITLVLAGSRVQKCFDFVRRTNCRKDSERGKRDISREGAARAPNSSSNHHWSLQISRPICKIAIITGKTNEPKNDTPLFICHSKQREHQNENPPVQM